MLALVFSTLLPKLLFVMFAVSVSVPLRTGSSHFVVHSKRASAIPPDSLLPRRESAHNSLAGCRASSSSSWLRPTFRPLLDFHFKYGPVTPVAQSKKVLKFLSLNLQALDVSWREVPALFFKSCGVSRWKIMMRSLPQRGGSAAVEAPVTGSAINDL